MAHTQTHACPGGGNTDSGDQLCTHVTAGQVVCSRCAFWILLQKALQNNGHCVSIKIQAAWWRVTEDEFLTSSISWIFRKHLPGEVFLCNGIVHYYWCSLIEKKCSALGIVNIIDSHRLGEMPQYFLDY